MENLELNLDELNTTSLLIALVEEEERSIRKSVAKRKLNYRGRYTNLIGYRNFFLDNELTKENAALTLDLTILEKALGKKELKTINA